MSYERRSYPGPLGIICGVCDDKVNASRMGNFARPVKCASCGFYVCWGCHIYASWKPERYESSRQKWESRDLYCTYCGEDSVL